MGKTRAFKCCGAAVERPGDPASRPRGPAGGDRAGQAPAPVAWTPKAPAYLARGWAWLTWHGTFLYQEILNR